MRHQAHDEIVLCNRMLDQAANYQAENQPARSAISLQQAQVHATLALVYATLEMTENT